MDLVGGLVLPVDEILICTKELPIFEEIHLRGIAEVLNLALVVITQNFID